MVYVCSDMDTNPLSDVSILVLNGLDISTGRATMLFPIYTNTARPIDDLLHSHMYSDDL